MKVTSFHRNLGANDVEQSFDLFVSTIRPSLKLWDFFVNWEKVFVNTRESEIQLNIWNYLIGKENFDQEFDELLISHPEIVMCIPVLIVRDGAHSKTFSIIADLADLGAPDLNFDFSVPATTPKARQDALNFVKSSGLIRLFAKDGVKNLVDYVLGVEAGLDSNGRKNRSGTSMEAVVGAILRQQAASGKFRVIEQATQSDIIAAFDITVPVDKSSRIYDFVLSDGNKLVILETNFYGGGGSKLKATAGEYKGLFSLLKSQGFDFIWVTDGAGWKTTLRPLREAFDAIDHLWNIKLLTLGALDEIF